MKSVSFFSSKGGVGKSIHTIMFASFLSYVKGKKVLVADLDHPVARVSVTRESELRQLDKPGSGLSVYFNRVGRPSGFYDIRSFVRKDEDSNPNFTKVVANRLKTFLLSSEGKQYDYVLIDLDASIGKNSLAFYIISGGACDMVFIPTNTELMNRQAAFYTAELCRLWEQPFHLFWNNVSSTQIAREGYLKQAAGNFTDVGYEFYPYAIKSFQRMNMDSGGMMFVKSTLCFPTRYVELACPELIPFYERVLSDLDETP